VELAARPDLDLAADVLRDRRHRLGVLGREGLRHVGMRVQLDAPAVQVRRRLGQLTQDLVADGLGGLDVAASLAVGTRIAELLHQVLARALAGHLDEPELRDLHHVDPRLVLAQCVLERLGDLVAVRRDLHVDQVEDDQPADVAEAELPHDLAHRLEVGLEDRLLEVPTLAAGEAAGVHVDRGQRLGLVDHQVAARLEPHLAPEPLLDVALDPVGVEDRLLAARVRDLRTRRRHEALHEVLHLAVGGVVVDHNLLGLVRDQVAQQPQVERGLLVDQRRRLLDRVDVLLDDLPALGQVLDVGLDVGLAHAVRDGAHDEAELPFFGTVLLDQVAEPAPLAVAGDAARHADPRDPRHQHQVAARQRYARGDARTLGAQRLLRHLHQDLAALFEHVFDLDAGAALRGSSTSAPSPAVAAIGPVVAGLAVAVLVVAEIDVVEVGAVVRHVQEAGPFKADVDERCLHARQYARDLSLKDSLTDASI
jgi:hypothetical protein